MERRRLSKEDVEIINRLQQGIAQKDIAEHLGRHESTISKRIKILKQAGIIQYPVAIVVSGKGETMLEKRIEEIAKMTGETDMFSGIFREFHELVKKIPLATMLRFKNDQRTVLIIHASLRVFYIIDTGPVTGKRRRVGKASIPRVPNCEAVVTYWGPEEGKKLIEFIANPATKMELLPIPQEKQWRKDTYSQYL